MVGSDFTNIIEIWFIYHRTKYTPIYTPSLL